MLVGSVGGLRVGDVTGADDVHNPSVRAAENAPEELVHLKFTNHQTRARPHDTS